VSRHSIPANIPEAKASFLLTLDIVSCYPIGMPRHIFRCYELSISLSGILLYLSSCSNVWPTLSPRERSQLIEQLQAARQTDLTNATDTRLGPDSAGDYMIQADKAETAIDDLNRSNNIPSSEIADALFVPPKHISPEMRARLIQQLEQAKALDDQRWLENLGGWNPTLTEDFNIQSMRAKRVINDLETGSPVSWFQIRQAMYVPDEVY
jgi:hypothetical protein